MENLHLIAEFFEKYGKNANIILSIIFVIFLVLLLKKIRPILYILFINLRKIFKRRYYIPLELFKEILECNGFKITNNPSDASLVEYSTKADNPINNISIIYSKFHDTRKCYECFLKIAPKAYHKYTSSTNNVVGFCEACGVDRENYFKAIYFKDSIIYSSVNLSMKADLDILLNLLLYKH